MDLPDNTYLPESEIAFPHYFVADAAFPLRNTLMRPYSGRELTADKSHFNAKLSSARRLIENSFGILRAKWRILARPINANPKNVVKIVKATLVLHNMIKMHDGTYCPEDYVDHLKNGVMVEGLWRKEVQPFDRIRSATGFNASRDAFALRNILKDYLLSRNH